jgi:hypothetical protein
MYLNIIKIIIDKSIANFKLNGEKLSNSSKVRNMIRIFILSTLIQYSAGIPSYSNKAR